MPKKKESRAEKMERAWNEYAKKDDYQQDLFSIKSKGFSGTKITKEQIDNMLKDPQKNYEKLQELSRMSMTKNGIYYRFIDRLAGLLLLHYVIAPKGNITLFAEKDVDDSFYKAAEFMQKLKIRDNFLPFMYDLLIDGEGYYFKFEDKNGIVFKKIPNRFCEPISLDIMGVTRFAIDLKKMKDENPLAYPSEIADAMELYKTNPDNAIFLNKQYYCVSNAGVCFKADKKPEGHGIPPFSFIFKTLLDYEKKREIELERDILDNVRMIHNKVPLSKKDDMPIFDPETARMFNEAIKMYLRQNGLENVFSIANPLEVDTINLNPDSGKSNSALTKDALNSTYSELGTSAMLFNSEKGGAESLKRGVVNDCALVINMFLPKFQSYINSELAMLSGKVKYACQMLDNTTENINERVKEAQSSMAYGGSRSIYLASLGMDILFAENLLKMERTRGMDEYLVPQQTSHTMSGKNTDNEVGQPSVEDKQANGEEVSDIADKQAN